MCRLGGFCPTSTVRRAGVGLVLSFSFLAGCRGFEGSAVALRIWAVPEERIIFPDTKPEAENDVFSRSEGGVRVAGAVGETVSFQLVLASDVPVLVRSVTVDDLRKDADVISADRVTFYRQRRVLVRDYPSWYLRLTPDLRRDRLFPDVLVPLTAPRGGLPVRVEPGVCQAFWVDVSIPPGTRAGLYRSTIRMRGGWLNLTRAVPLTLEVWPFALPRARHLPVLAGVDTGRLLRHHLEVGGRPYAPGRLTFDDPHYEQARAVLDRAVQLLHAHRCEAMLRDVQPLGKVGPDGRLALDWLDYDRLAAPILDGSAFEDRAAAAAWPMPVDERHPDPDLYGGWEAPEYAAVLGRYLHLCADHFANQGWLDRHFVWLPTGGGDLAERTRRFVHLAKVLRAADPRLELICPLAPASGRGSPTGPQREDPLSLAGIWAPPAGRADLGMIRKLRERDVRTWLYPDQPPVSGSLAMMAPATYVRVLAWQAYRIGCDGVLVPAVNDWPDDGRPSAAVARGCLLWPGKPYGLEGPVPSIRLKRLRRGLQDYEYLWLLERNRRPAVARRVARDLCRWAGSAAWGEHFLDGRPGGWVTNPAAWSLARRLLAQELIAAMVEPPHQATPGDLLDEPAELDRFGQRIEWARFRQIVREARVAVEGVRLRPDDTPTSPPTVAITVSVANFTAEPLTGTLELLEPPEGWAPAEPAAAIEKLPPAKVAVRTLRVKASSLNPDAEGVIPCKVGLRRPDGEPSIASGRLALLTSLKLARPLTIDGRLDDWPLGAGNVAGDFLLVGASTAPKRGLSRPDRPTQATTAFVTHDDANLYIAFLCRDDRLGARHIRRDNAVYYDGLWPARDDLVEVVLDPTGRAAGPQDLFHVVVKANGAVITGRGVPCLGEVAPCVPWAAGATAAVDDRCHPDRWTVEIRIPLSSLGPRAEYFGINFARFVPRLGEYSCWSGADRYVYSPTFLGNIRLKL